MAKKKKNTTRCLTCTNLAQSRGLCWTCLRSANAAIESGKITEEEAFRRKMILPRRSPGRPATSGFNKKLAKLK